MSYTIQGPEESIRWTFDFAGSIPEGESIGEAAVTCDEPVAIADVAVDGGTVTCLLSGVPFGRVARLLCVASLSGGETLEKVATMRGGRP